MWSELPANLYADHRRQHGTEVEKAHAGILRAQCLVTIFVVVGAGRGVQEREPARTASIVSHAQVQGAAARRDVVARLVAEFDLRATDSTESSATFFGPSTTSVGRKSTVR